MLRSLFAAAATAVAVALPTPALAQAGALGFNGVGSSFFTDIRRGVRLGDIIEIEIQEITIESATGIFVPPFTESPGTGVVTIDPFMLELKCIQNNCTPAPGTTILDAYELNSMAQFVFNGSLTDPGAFDLGDVILQFPAGTTDFDIIANDDGTTYSLELDQSFSSGATVLGLDQYDPDLDPEILLTQEILSLDTNLGSEVSVYQGLVARTEDRTDVPAPLPLLGLAGFWGYSRKLRQRIKAVG